MKREELRKYVYDTCQFDINKEKVIHMYLCKEELNKKQKKLLNEEDKFLSYGAWKAYIADKYNIYSKGSLIEFDKILNLLIFDAERMDGYNQCIWTAYISAILAVIMSVMVNELKVSAMSLIVSIIFIPCLIVLIIGKVFNIYNSEKGTLLFLKDIKEIIEELIKSK